jgi:arylformamidase
MSAKADPAWLQAQYDNRTRVPGYGVYLRRWAEDSAQVRSERRCVLDVRYGDGSAERLDVFPASRSDAPVLVYIHGGWWRALDKSDGSFVAPAFTDAGAMVVVPNYALCPVVTVEHIVLQMARALAWVWRHAHAYGGDRTRIVVAGHSAGGHIAAMLACCRWPELAADLPADLMRGAMSISGVFDLAPLRRTAFLQADLKLSARDVRRLSPAALPAPNGPLYALVGGDESEEFQRHNQLIRRRWGAAAVPVCEVVPGADHFSVLDSLAGAQGRAHQLACRLLQID